MKSTLCLILFLTGTIVLDAQTALNYLLRYTPGSGKIKISLDAGTRKPGDTRLVIPRSGPGTYQITDYLAFVNRVEAHTESGKSLQGVIGDGSYFEFNGTDESVDRVSYEVDIRKMELALIDGSTSSKEKEGYLGLLGYSVFGFVEGEEEKPIRLTIETDPTWPVFSTLRPGTERKKGTDVYEVENFDLLADGQYLLGPQLEVLEVKNAPIPLFVAMYSQAPVRIEEFGTLGLRSLQGLSDYYGYIPMPHYTLFYEFLVPVSERHSYNFLMEHMNSMSATRDTSGTGEPNYYKNNLGGIVHHMGHSWIPLRTYGKGYRPFEWQTAPMIETIWLNEGFTWYIAMHEVLGRNKILDFFRNTINRAPAFIKQKSLQELSQLGSSQYSLDFRIGKELFSRGALMAHDMDSVIRQQTGGQKSFREAALGLLKWTEKNKRAFNYDEIEPILSTASGVSLKETWDRWQRPTAK